MRGRVVMLQICLLWIALLTGDLALAAPSQADSMTKEELLPLLGKPDVTVIDLRFGRDWYDSDLKIKGAVREDPMKPGQWTDKYPKTRCWSFIAPDPTTEPAPVWRES